VKKQTDKALRIFLGFEKEYSSSIKLYTKTAYIKDELHYEDVSILMRTQNKTQQFYQEFGWKKSIRHQQEILIFTPITIAWMRPHLDTITRYQNRFAIAAAYSIKALKQKLHYALNARFETINATNIFLIGTNARFAVHPYVQLRANLQKSYRAPTLNEWYFQPGGNVNLKPEKGWNADAGYELTMPLKNNILLKHDLSMFNRNIQDWILWYGGSIWTPHNIAKVHSRGIESFNSLHWKYGDWQTQLGLNSSFVLATTIKSHQANDGSIGKQIPYSPRYNGQALVGFSFKKISCKYNHTYTGYRFVTTDESQYVAPYHTGNIFAAYDLDLKKTRLQINIQCNNLWNEKYQVVHLRPMPLRNWAMGFNAAF
jgi:iron complex outermembrane receptor protein